MLPVRPRKTEMLDLKEFCLDRQSFSFSQNVWSSVVMSQAPKGLAIPFGVMKSAVQGTLGSSLYHGHPVPPCSLCQILGLPGSDFQSALKGLEACSLKKC